MEISRRSRRDYRKPSVFLKKYVVLVTVHLNLNCLSLRKSIRKLKKTEGSTETRTLCLSLMMHLAICNNELPRSLYIGDDAAFIVDCPNEHSQGAFGKVYKVSRIRDKKVVAIKVPQGWVQNEMKVRDPL